MDYNGYWLNSKTGKLIKTQEHGSTVIKTPAAFGISPKDVKRILNKDPYDTKSTRPTESRPKLLKLAFQNNWVRVREVGPSWTFEFYGNMQNVIDKIIKKFGDDMGPFTRINLHDISNNDNKSMTFSEMSEMYFSGGFSDEQANTRDILRQRLFPAGATEQPKFKLESLKRTLMKKLFSR